MTREEYKNKVLLEIAVDLLTMCDTVRESVANIKGYKMEYPNEPDYNIAQYGNLIISYYDVCQFYKNAGVKRGEIAEKDYCKLWERYLRDVGDAVRLLTSDALFIYRALKKVEELEKVEE